MKKIYLSLIAGVFAAIVSSCGGQKSNGVELTEIKRSRTYRCRSNIPTSFLHNVIRLLRNNRQQ